MTRQIVNDKTPKFVLPTVRIGVPLPPLSGRGRPTKPQNPLLVSMKPGESFVVTGKEECDSIRADIQRFHKAKLGKLVTRTLSGTSTGETDQVTDEFSGEITEVPRLYPAETMGVWCLTGQVIVDGEGAE